MTQQNRRRVIDLIHSGEVERTVIQKIRGYQGNGASPGSVRRAGERIVRCAEAWRKARSAQTAGEQRERDGVSLAHKESGGLAVLRAQENLAAALHQRERIGKVRRRRGKSQEERGFAASHGDEGRDEGTDRSSASGCGTSKDSGQERFESSQVACVDHLAQQIGRESDHPITCRRLDAQLPCGVAVNFEQLDFQHQFSARPFDLLNKSAGESQPLRSVAHGDGVATRVEINARGSRDIAQDAYNFRGLLGTDGGRKRKRLLGFQIVLPAFFRIVCCDKHQRGIHRAPEGPGLSCKDGDRVVEVHVAHVQSNVSHDQVRIESGPDAKHGRELFVDRFCVAPQIDMVLSRLRLQPGQPGNFRGGFRPSFIRHALDLPQPFQNDGVRRINRQRSSKVFGGLIKTAGKRVPLCCVGVRTDQFPPQRLSARRIAEVLWSIPRSFFVISKRLLRTASRLSFFALFGGFARALEIGLHPLGVGLRSGWRRLSGADR